MSVRFTNSQAKRGTQTLDRRPKQRKVRGAKVGNGASCKASMGNAPQIKLTSVKLVCNSFMSALLARGPLLGVVCFLLDTTAHMHE